MSSCILCGGKGLVSGDVNCNDAYIPDSRKHGSIISKLSGNSFLYSKEESYIDILHDKINQVYNEWLSLYYKNDKTPLSRGICRKCQEMIYEEWKEISDINIYIEELSTYFNKHSEIIKRANDTMREGLAFTPMKSKDIYRFEQLYKKTIVIGRNIEEIKSKIDMTKISHILFSFTTEIMIKNGLNLMESKIKAKEDYCSAKEAREHKLKHNRYLSKNMMREWLGVSVSSFEQELMHISKNVMIDKVDVYNIMMRGGFNECCNIDDKIESILNMNLYSDMAAHYGSLYSEKVDLKQEEISLQNRIEMLGRITDMKYGIDKLFKNKEVA